MSLLNTLKNISVKLEQKNDSLFNYPVKKQKAYLKSFSEPRDDIERAYNQYKCQLKFNNVFVRAILNMGMFPMLLMSLMKKTEKPKHDKHYDAVFFSDGKPENIIPDQLRDKYKKWITIENKHEYFSKEDRKYFRKLFRRYPFSWYFLFKCLLKIRFYSYEIEAHNPGAFVVCNEYSFTSSLLTDYCHMRERKNINVMHGEKLYFMRDSFFHFSECYVWNEAYINLFKSLRAESNQFVVAAPRSLLFPRTENVEKEYDYTYYIGFEENEVLSRVLDSMRTLTEKGYKVSLRPHPRYSDIEQIKKDCADVEIEDANSLSIEKSLLRTRYAIARYSTVLNQAINNGTGVVIDDISVPESFAKLKELKYVLLDMDHKLLSEII